MAVSSTSGRVSELTRIQQLLSSIRKSQSALNLSQLQMTTGHRIIAASEDPVAASRMMDLSTLLGRYGQFQTNTKHADGLTGSADLALGDAVDILRQVHTLAASSVGTTASDSERAGNAQVVTALIDQLQRLANRQYQGQYLFDGLAGRGEPFSQLGGGMLYSGDSDAYRLQLDAAWQMQVALDGNTVFGAHSVQANGVVDLVPTMTSATRLADLGGATGQGVTAGAIVVSNGVDPAVTIDLSATETVGDLINAFNNNAPAGLLMQIDPSGQKFRIVVGLGKAVTVQDVAGGSMARQLGITSTAVHWSMVGQPVDPHLTGDTSLASIAGGALDKASGINIINGSLSASLTFDSSQTVQDVLNTINNAGAGVRARISEDGRGITIVNTISGTNLQITENGGTTASGLGIRTFYGSARLADLNGGRGVSVAGDGLADVRIFQRDGTHVNVSFDGCATINDVVAAINSAPGNTGDLVASIATDGGLRLVDSSVDAGVPLSVTAMNVSTAVSDLGLDVSASGDMLTGRDVSGVRTNGVFDHLFALRDAMRDNDTQAIADFSARIERDLERIIEVQGTVGAQAAQVSRQADKLDETALDTETMLTEIRDLDLTEAVMRFEQLQQQLTASLMTAGKLLDVTLLDFIR